MRKHLKIDLHSLSSSKSYKFLLTNKLRTLIRLPEEFLKWDSWRQKKICDTAKLIFLITTNVCVCERPQRKTWFVNWLFWSHELDFWCLWNQWWVSHCIKKTWRLYSGWATFCLIGAEHVVQTGVLPGTQHIGQISLMSHGGKQMADCWGTVWVWRAAADSWGHPTSDTRHLSGNGRMFSTSPFGEIEFNTDQRDEYNYYWSGF